VASQALAQGGVGGGQAEDGEPPEGEGEVEHGAWVPRSADRDRSRSSSHVAANRVRIRESDGGDPIRIA